MRGLRFLSCSTIISLIFITLSCTSLEKGTSMNSSDIGKMMAAVRLQEDSLFGQSQKVGLEYVLRLEPDRLLAPVYEALGRGSEAKAARYGGWESRQIAGHSLGHYLSALAAFWQVTGDPRLEERIRYVLKELDRLQRFDGYLGGVESRPFDIVATGTFSVDAFSLAGYWVPWYSIHKIYAGLIDVYMATGNPLALSVVRRMADWAINRTSAMTEQQFQRMLDCEHGGMCEVFAELYALTGEKKYLTMAERFIHHRIMDPLMKEIDVLQGLHANTQIPKVIGLARLYEVTGKEEYRRAAEFFFKNVVDHRSYVIGGNSVREHFGPTDQERLARDTCETCNTYNMLKLAEHLFRWNHSSYYADFYERALYNHILASQEPETGAKCYFMSTDPGHFKVYGTEDNSFWCCTGTGMENPARYNRFIWVREGNILYINLFIPSRYESEGSVIQLITNFPYEMKGHIEINPSLSTSSSQGISQLRIRRPAWAGDTFKVLYNGKAYTTEDHGYITVPGPFLSETSIQLEWSMGLHVYITRDRERRLAFMYGPLVLAARLGQENFPSTDVVGDHLSLMYHPDPTKIGAFLGDPQNPSQWIKIKDPARLEFETLSGAFSEGQRFILIPYFALHHERYTIYFDSQEYKAPSREDLYGPQTIDKVYPGQQQSEIEHDLKSKQSYSGYLPSVDMTWRDARGLGAYFSYRMKFKKDRANTLLVAYYGLDGPVGAFKRKFTISVNGTVIATEELHPQGVDGPVDVKYQVDPEILKNLPTDENGFVFAELRFATTGGTSYAGGILELRVLTEAP